MVVITIFYDDCSDDHAIIVVLLVYLLSGIPNCKAVIRSLIYKLMSHLNESTNDVILAILSSDIRWTSRIGLQRYWVNTLYMI